MHSEMIPFNKKTKDKENGDRLSLKTTFQETACKKLYVSIYTYVGSGILFTLVCRTRDLWANKVVVVSIIVVTFVFAVLLLATFF